MIIESFQNPKIKNIIKLRKSRERKKQKLLVVEGRHEISLAEEAGLEMVDLLICYEFKSDENFFVKKDKTTEVSAQVFKKISARENPDGFLAVFQSSTFDLAEVKLPDRALVLVLDRIEKPGNLGAMLRTADGAGVDLVIVSGGKTDIYNHNVIRASLGTVFCLQIVTCSTENCIKWLREQNISVVATTPRAEKSYTQEDLNNSVAIVVGTEHEGLGNEWLNQKFSQVKIPMNGKIDSLNASVSAALLLYEVRRQREVRE